MENVFRQLLYLKDFLSNYVIIVFSSDIFMGVCALFSVIVSVISLFIISSNIIEINKKVSIKNFNSKVTKIKKANIYNQSISPYNKIKYEQKINN